MAPPVQIDTEPFKPFHDEIWARQLRRVVDVALACLLVGIVATGYMFAQTGQFTPWALITVPFMVVVALSMGFLGAVGAPLLLPLGLATLAVVVVCYFADRLVSLRWLRVLIEAVILGLHAGGVTYL